jgi:hypothetical protein
METTGSIFEGPNLSPLTGAVANDRARADEFYRQLAKLQQDYQQQLAAQSALTRGLDRTIAGTAPSVAGTQLQQGLGQTRNAISAQASGASGQNAAMANYGAVQALAQAQAKQQQDAALLRAKEVSDAQALKANVLNQQQGATGVQSGQATAGATGLSGQENTSAGNLAAQNAAEVASNRALFSNLVSGVGNAAVAGGASSSAPAPTAKSDEETKTNKTPIAKGEMDQFLDHISGFTFKYKPGEVDETAPAGKRVGQMAQDVNKGGPIGAAVSDGKEIDMRNAIGALLAAVSHVNRKVEARG